MAFIRHKQVNGATYYTLVESYRANGKVRQRVIASLGQEPTIAGALEVQRYRLAIYQKARDAYPRGRWLFTGPGRSRAFGEGILVLPCGKDAEPIINRIEHVIEVLEHWQRREPFAIRAGRSAKPCRDATPPLALQS